MEDKITDEKLAKYIEVSEKALAMARDAPVNDAAAEIIIDMASRYISDAKHFLTQENKVLAFAAINYAHGWLDCGARLNYFIVKDDNLFTVDNE